MSGFKHDKQQQSSSKVEKEPRRDNQSAQQDGRNAERRERHTGTKVGRDMSLRRNDQSGRASQFYATYKEYRATEPEVDHSRLLQVGADLARNLSADRGYLIYVTNVDGDVFWHLLILETNRAGGECYTRKPVNDRNRGRNELDVYRYLVSMDGVSNELLNVIEDWLTKSVPASKDYVFANATVIPGEIDLSDVGVIEAYVRVADDACYTVANADEPFTPDEIEQNQSVRGRLSFNAKNTIDDAVGQTRRSDFSVTIETHSRDSGDNPLLSGQGNQTLVAMDGFVNARYVGPVVHPRDLRRDERFEPACFIPEVIFDTVDVLQPIVIGNYERMLLALSAAPFINTNQRWMQQYRHSIHGRNDEGALSGFAYGMTFEDGKLPSDEVMKEVDTNPEAFESWMDNVFQLDEGVEFSMMIREGDIGYTHTKLFQDIAVNDDVDAYDVLIDACDDLTGDEFSRLWGDNRGCSDVIVDYVRLPTGYFVTGKQGNQPIELVDTLHVLNKVKNNYPDMINDWYDCTEVGSRVFDFDESTTRLVRLLQEVTGEQFKLKGFVTKVTFNPEFLKTLHDAVRKSKLGLQMEMDGDDTTSRDRRYRGNSARHTLSNDLARGERRTYRGDRSDRGYVSQSYRRHR